MCNVNGNVFSFKYNLANPSIFGLTYPFTGIFATKFHMNGSGVVTGSNIVFSKDPGNSGNSVYSVILNSAGVIVNQSASYIILPADTGVNKHFSFPGQTAFSNEDFYIGLAKINNAAPYRPLGIFPESPPRPNTYYTFNLAGGILTLLTGFDIEYGIEATSSLIHV